MILRNRVFMANERVKSGSHLKYSPHRIFWCGLLLLLQAGSLRAQQGTSVSARFAAVQGIVMVTTQDGGEKQVIKGDTIRSGTVISSGITGGSSLKPLPTLSVVVYPETKLRFDNSSVSANGGGEMMCSLIAGKVLFHVDLTPPGNSNANDAPSNIKVTVVTDEGIIMNNTGGRPKPMETIQQGDTATSESKSATWTVQHDEGRTVVAVSEGLSEVSIGKGSAAANGSVGGQVKVPQGSVIWLSNRDGKIEAQLVDTQSGKVTNLTGGTSGGSSLVEQSRQQLVSPSSSSTTSTSGAPPGTPGTPASVLPTNTSSNPDLSMPQKKLPVVSADTP
jgi:hypothetical protein